MHIYICYTYVCRNIHIYLHIYVCIHMYIFILIYNINLYIYIYLYESYLNESGFFDFRFSNRQIWFDATTFRKRKLNHIDIPCSQLSNEMKISLYESEHASKRRKKKRK